MSNRDAIEGLRRELEACRSRLEITTRELEDLADGVSHGMRAPLRMASKALGLLWERPPADEEGRHDLVALSTAIDEMRRMTDAVLLLSRRSRAPLQRAGVDQQALVTSILREGRFSRGGRGVQWTVAPLPPVEGDPSLLQQVWFNLIDNAVKFSRDADPPRVEIGLADAPQDVRVFYVRDNGIGFDMERAGSLFRVFERLHPLTQVDGVGMGLAVVRRIVSRHGGRTWAESRPGFGATFYFSLPTSPDT